MTVTDPRSLIKIISITVGLLILLSYGYFQARTVIAGPTLQILSPHLRHTRGLLDGNQEQFHGSFDKH